MGALARRRTILQHWMLRRSSHLCKRELMVVLWSTPLVASPYRPLLGPLCGTPLKRPMVHAFACRPLGAVWPETRRLRPEQWFRRVPRSWCDLPADVYVQLSSLESVLAA